MDLREMATFCARSHALPYALVEGICRYWLEAVDREAWTVTYMDVCAEPYAGRPRRGERALDAGSGSGGAVVHLASRFDEVAGVDPDLPALLVAARRCLDHGVGARVFLIAGMLEQELWPPGAFDAVKCTDVIEHVADPQQAARAMASAIEGRGIAFVLTPDRWSLFTREPHVGLWACSCFRCGSPTPG